MSTRVLVARLDNIGDVLLTGPAIRALAAGDADVTLLCASHSTEAARLLPGVRTVAAFDAPWILADAPPVRRSEVEALVEDVAARGFDQALVLTSFHQSPLPLALLLRMAGVSAVAANSDDYPGSLLDVRNLVPDDIHEVERNLSLVARLGYRLPPGDDGRLSVQFDAPNPLHATPAYVVLHIGASVPARAWSAEANVAAAGALSAAGWQVVLTGGPAEQRHAEAVAEAASHACNLVGATSLSELARIFSDASAVIVGNTGPAHLAAAVGTPVVSVFAPTVPAARWRPWMVPHVLLGRQDIACAGCRARICPVPGHPCIETVTSSELSRAVAAVARVPAEA